MLENMAKFAKSEHPYFWHKNLKTVPRFSTSFIDKFAADHLSIKATSSFMRIIFTMLKVRIGSSVFIFSFYFDTNLSLLAFTFIYNPSPLSV